MKDWQPKIGDWVVSPYGQQFSCMVFQITAFQGSRQIMIKPFVKQGWDPILVWLADIRPATQAEIAEAVGKRVCG